MQIFTAILDAFHHFVRIARASPQAEHGAIPRFSERTTTYCTMTCAEKKRSFCSFSFCFPSSPQRHPSYASGNAAKRSPHPIINQTIAHDGQRTEEKLQKAVSGRARGVGERILPERENIDIQKTSEKFCDPQIYP